MKRGVWSGGLAAGSASLAGAALAFKKEKSHAFWENSILLWEEPEFYLNPQQERACYDALLQNTKLGLMAVVSTNSSRFIELENYQSLCIFRRIKEDVEIYQYSKNTNSAR